MSQVKITREDLYKEVWSRPITHIAKSYGISDSAIIKICKKLEVPRPNVGHWAKVAHGKPPRQPKLNKLSKKGQEAYYLRSQPHYERFYNGNDQTERLAQQLPKINIPALEEQTHPLIKRYGKSFNQVSRDEYGALQPRAEKHFDFRISAYTKTRALTILNALLLFFDERKWVFNLTTDPDKRMTVTLQGEEVAFSINERFKRVPFDKEKIRSREQKQLYHYWIPKYEYIPSGELTIKLESFAWLARRQSWSDGKTQKVETQLDKFCSELLRHSERIIRYREERLREERAAATSQENIKQLKALRQAELKERNELEEDCESWHKAQRLRSYIEHALSQQPEQKEWAKWASNYADLIDPTTKGVETIAEVAKNYLVSFN